MHATGDLSRLGVGWVPAAAAGLALLALTWWGKFRLVVRPLLRASDSSTAGDQEQRDPPRWRGARSGRPGVLRYRAPRL